MAELRHKVDIKVDGLELQEVWEEEVDWEGAVDWDKEEVWEGAEEDWDKAVISVKEEQPVVGR